MRHFPFDSHDCSIEIGSINYLANEVSIIGVEISLPEAAIHSMDKLSGGSPHIRPQSDNKSNV